jgi:hypothetical protein
VLVRKHALILLTQLLLQDYIKWRGLLLFRFLATAVGKYVRAGGCCLSFDLFISYALLTSISSVFPYNFFVFLPLLFPCLFFLLSLHVFSFPVFHSLLLSVLLLLTLFYSFLFLLLFLPFLTFR